MLRRATFALLVCAFWALAAPAAFADDAAVCKDDSAPADSAIEACTRIIKAAGRSRGNELAMTYYNRAISYRQKNDN